MSSNTITWPMVVRFVISMALAVIVIVIAIILGDYGPWYFSWILGTGFMMLAAVSGAVLLDAQDEARAAGKTGSALKGKLGARSGY